MKAAGSRIARRGALLSLPALAAAEGVAGAEPGPSPIVAQALRFEVLQRREDTAAAEHIAALGTAAERPAADAAWAASDARDAAVRALAGLPADCLPDALAKAVVLLCALADGDAVADEELGESLLADLTRLAPELRPLLRWALDRGREPWL